MSFDLDIAPKDRAASRFIGKVRRALINAAMEEKSLSGVTQQGVAERLGVNRSVVNRLLRGSGNLTLRTIAEIAWAIGWEPVLDFRRKSVREGTNEVVELPKVNAARTVTSSQMSPQGAASPASSLAPRREYVVTRTRENA